MPQLSNLPNISKAQDFPLQFPVGTKVRLQNCHNNLWDDIGTIVKIMPSGRSYLIERDSGGQSVVRNHRFLRKLKPILRHGTPSTPLKARHIIFVA